MLFVSRRIGFDSFGVVDTDDGREEIVTWSKLRKVVHDGVQVYGVDFVNTVGEGYRCLIDVYQPSNTITQLQLKTKVLQGVEIVTYGKSITGIRLLGSKSKVVLKLSDYGAALSECIFACNAPGYKGDITFVVDSKLKPRYGAFSLSRVEVPARFTIGSLGVKLDISGVFSESVYGIYKAIFEVNYDDKFDEIIDVDERKHLMRAKVRGLA